MKKNLLLLSIILMILCIYKIAFSNTLSVNKPIQASASSSGKSLVSREPAKNAAPFGLEIGYANLKGVKEKIGSITKLKYVGIYKYSNGPMLTSNGDRLEIDGLSEVVFIFDKENVLAAVILTLPKNPKDMYAKLSSKYEVVTNRIDTFMNNGYARFKKGDSIIEIDAPHLSFTMEVRYLTNSLMSNYLEQSSKEKTRKDKETTNKL